MNFAWRLLECIPKRSKYKEWPKRHSFLGHYIPCGEPRFIGEGAVIHESVIKRIAGTWAQTLRTDFTASRVTDTRRSTSASVTTSGGA